MTVLPQRLVDMLLAARQAETAARGARRQDALRISRYLIAGCRSAGIPSSALAEVLSVRASTIRSRGTIDGLIPATVFSTLTGVGVDDITDWVRRGLLPRACPDAAARTSYPSSALISALLRTDRPRKAAEPEPITGGS